MGLTRIYDSRGRSVVMLEEPAEALVTAHLAELQSGRARNRNVPDALMGTFGVVVLDVVRNSPSEPAVPEENHPLQTLGLGRQHESLGVGVGVRRHVGGDYDLAAGFSQGLPEVRGELRIANRRSG